jgi:hypothetical protein
MKRTAVTSLLILTSMGALAEAAPHVEGETHIADKSRAAAVHKLAIISITGPGSFKVAMSKIPATDVVNEVEDKLVKTLQADGFSIVPLADTKAFASANWQSIYYENLPDKLKQQGKAKNMTPEQQLAALKMVNAGGAVLGNLSSLSQYEEGDQIATPNTIAVQDFVDTRARHAEEVKSYGPVFCKTMGELARRLGADAAVIVETDPGMLSVEGITGGRSLGSGSSKKGSASTGFGSLVRSVKEPLGSDHPEEILHMVIIDPSGEYVFGERITVSSEEKQGVGGLTLHFDAEKTLKGVREATDELMTKLLEHYPK